MSDEDKLPTVPPNARSGRDDAHERSRRQGEVVAAAVKRLAANLMRITAGAGSPLELVQEAGKVRAAMEEYEGVPGYVRDTGLENTIREALRLPETGTHNTSLSAEEREWGNGEWNIMQGALRYVASTLVGQHSQASAGHQTMNHGARTIGKISAERLKRNSR